MSGIRTRSAAVLVTVGVVAAVVAAVLLRAGTGRVDQPSVTGTGQVREREPAPEPFPEEAPAPVPAGQAGDSPPMSETSTSFAAVQPEPVTAARDSMAPVDGRVAAESGGVSDPEAGSETAAGPAPGLEAPLEIVEAADPGPLAGGVQQEPPLEQEGSDGSDAGSGGPASSQGKMYTWHDGDRVLGVRLQTDLVVADEGAVRSRDEVVADTGKGRVVRRSDGSGAEGTDPVFRSEAGDLMTLPGGVILFLDPEWNPGVVAGFFAVNGIDPGRVSELGYRANGFFVETEPGFASLELANALAGQPGVDLSSPNWWTDHTAE